MQITRAQNQPNFKANRPKIKFQNPDDIARYLPYQGQLSLGKQTVVLRDLTSKQDTVFGIHFDIRDSLPFSLTFSKVGQPLVNARSKTRILPHSISEEGVKLIELAKKEDAAPIMIPIPQDNAMTRIYKRLLLANLAKQEGVAIYDQEKIGEHLSSRGIGMLWRQAKEIGRMGKDMKSFEIGFVPTRIAPFSVSCETNAATRAHKQNIMNIDIAPTAKALREEALEHSASPVLYQRQSDEQTRRNRELLDALESL